MNFLDALSYPVRRGGWLMIVLGAVFSVILDVLQFAPAIGIGVGVFGAGYFGAYYLDIVKTTMTGRDELPEWPGFGSFADDILSPFIDVVGLLLISFGPAVAVLFLVDHDESRQLLAFFGALAYGCFYFPMAVLALHAFGGLGAALPHVVFPAIFRSLPGYLLAVVALVTVVVLCAVAQAFIRGVPYVGWFLTSILALYSLLFQGRLIGLIYRDKCEKLGWE